MKGIAGFGIERKGCWDGKELRMMGRRCALVSGRGWSRSWILRRSEMDVLNGMRE
jgi:hypothetical protein